MPQLRILNVNDDDALRGYKTALLTDAGFSVVETGRASEAVRIARADPPDLILLDVHLLDGNGVDICRQLQPADEGHDTFEGDRHFAIVLISAHVTQPEDIARGMSAGADAYLVEPLEDAYLIGIVCALAERHARRRAAASERAALRARDFRYRTLAATVGDVVYDWDLTTDRVEWSDAVYRMLRYRQELVGSTSQWWVDRIHSEDRARVLSEVHRTFTEKQTTRETEYRFARSDGSYVVLVDRATTIYADDGTPLRAIGAMSDITERRRLADQLRLAQKMEAVGQLAGGIAHDFNNVLTSVLGFAGLLKYELTDRPTAFEHATEIETAAVRAVDLVGQLLAFSRRQVLKAEVLDLNQTVEGSARMLYRLMPAHIRVEHLLAAPLPAVRADRTQLEQVLLNLVVNARDAMPSGGKITITTGVVEIPRTPREARMMQRGRYVHLSVTDTGVGMDETTRSRIFEPFFTTKERGRGTGLGLATVYGIVKQSGGYIFVTSAEGEGTTFDLYLPALDVAATLEPEHESAAPLESHGETVLIVEDEDSVRRLAKQVLSRAGYRVLEAADGREALAAANQFPGPIHLLLADIVLPGLSGVVVAEKLRILRPEIRVLFTSGYSSETHGGFINGAAPLLPKPFSRELLLNEVGRLLTSGSGAAIPEAL
jgi:two-component system cell cycle sensor histidine kinase/response regulator CckA